MHTIRRAFSLIELLVCVAIISVLVGISFTAYQGALDNSDLKYAAPLVTGMLDSLRAEAGSKGSTITVDFQIGSTSCFVTKRKGSEVTTETLDCKEAGIIKRPLRFLRYKWPDGATTPATFTFTGSAKPQGGTVFFGTGNAETAIQVEGGRVYCEFGTRAAPRPRPTPGR